MISLVLSIVICIWDLCPVKANNQIEKTEKNTSWIYNRRTSIFKINISEKGKKTATAKETGKRHNNSVVVETHTQSVTLICGSNGTFY